MDTVLQQQIEREHKMFDQGRQRYMGRLKKNQSISTQDNPHSIITNALTRVSKAISAAIDAETESKGRGRKFAWYYDIQGLDTDLLAYLGLNTCMDSVSIGASLTSALTKIGKRVELEVWALGLKEHDSKLSKRIETKVTKDHSSEVYRIKAAKIIAKKAGYEFEKWTEERRVKVATVILNAILEYSSVFDVWEQKRPRNTIRRIGLTPAASNQLANMDHQCSWQEPMLAPLIVPPKTWTSFNSGCYMDDVTAGMVPLVRSASPEQRKAVQHQLAQGTPLYVEALNALQATPLKINTYVLDVVNKLWDQGIAFGKFPRKHHMEHLKRPEAWDDMDDFAKKGWSLKARAVREKNREIDGSIAMMTQDLGTANDLAKFDSFWLGWNFDFRGRVYPVSHFSYHRDDHIKAVFNLARGKTMDADAVSWLAVHIANVGDFDKISKQSLDARIAWVEDNSENLYQVGRDPIATFDYWSKADKPFQFLAACHELANYMDVGPDYVCSLPPQLDGTNSGVQHYAAASLNKEDGKMVNLVPADKPQDIYQSVADSVLCKLNESKEPEAELWLDYGVSRTTVKRNTMTYGYSSGKYGFGDQLYDDVMRPLDDQVMRGTLTDHPFGIEERDQKKSCSFLAGINYQSIQEVISSAAQGMKFFQDIAGALAHENKGVRFETPIGFPVFQQYSHWDVKKVKIYLFDRDAKVKQRTQISIRTKPVQKIDKRKAKSAVSPNIIHSMDSAHLLMTVLLAKDNGVEDFFMIHDSFGTLPADTNMMYQAVRRTFVDIYSNWCLYESFFKQATSNLSYTGLANLNVQVPEKGDLDLNQVIESEYCFS
jgi:DNA-directed RNA polymerase